MLYHNVEFVRVIKENILDYKEIHKNSELNPNLIWDAFKCYIAGICLQYSSRKKKEKSKIKQELLEQISNYKQEMVNLQSDTGGGNTKELL